MVKLDASESAPQQGEESPLSLTLLNVALSVSLANTSHEITTHGLGGCVGAVLALQKLVANAAMPSTPAWLKSETNWMT